MNRKTGYNIVLAIGGANGFVSTEVQGSTFLLRISVSAKNPTHRQYAARYRQGFDDSTQNINSTQYTLYYQTVYILTGYEK